MPQPYVRALAACGSDAAGLVDDLVAEVTL